MRAYYNTHHITVSGKHGFLIEQLNTEFPQPKQRDFTDNTAWQKLFSDVNDPKNLGVADINYWCCQWGVGVVESFTRISSTNIRVRWIGSALVDTGTTGNPAHR